MLTGTVFADVLIGSSGDDQINGADGNDRIEGGAGNDVLYHYAGSATINGGAGDDLIIVSPFSYAAGQATPGRETVDGGSGSNQLTINWTGLNVTDSFTGFSGNALLARAGGGSPSDIFTVNATNIQVLRFLGTEGADTLNSAGGADDLNGGGGSDTIHGGAGDDVIGGGPGDDRLFGDDGFDRYDIETTVSVFVARTLNASGLIVVGDNVVVTDTFGGRDTLSGFEGVALRGGYADDVLTGGAGSDLLDGSFGSDTTARTPSSTRWATAPLRPWTRSPTSSGAWTSSTSPRRAPASPRWCGRVRAPSSPRRGRAGRRRRSP